MNNIQKLAEELHSLATETPMSDPDTYATLYTAAEEIQKNCNARVQVQLLTKKVEKLTSKLRSEKLLQAKPSRLEIAAMALQGMLANPNKIAGMTSAAITHADALIAAAKRSAK